MWEEMIAITWHISQILFLERNEISIFKTFISSKEENLHKQYADFAFSKHYKHSMYIFVKCITCKPITQFKTGNITREPWLN